VPAEGSLLIEMLVRPEEQSSRLVLNNRFVSRIAAKTVWLCRYVRFGPVRYLMLIKLSGFSFYPSSNDFPVQFMFSSFPPLTLRTGRAVGALGKKLGD